MTTLYEYTTDNNILAKKKKKKMEKNTASKWQPNKRFLARVILILAKI